MELVRFLLLIIILLQPAAILAQDDPLDPFDFSFSEDSDISDQDKSVDKLIRESLLIMEDRPLDARTKLLLALKKDPQSVYAMMLLSSYYSRYINHYRLAMKYVKKAELEFKKQYGEAPYYSPLARYLHSDILRQLSQLHLSLDKYNQALEELELQKKYDYEDPYYYSSKAWILFKMGRYQEAIAVAREGIQAGLSIGATLNVLGILLSTNEQREESIKVFEQAINYEKTLGSLGNPATPINNMGEVYREIFQEEDAANAWHRAMRLPDGCEHILPSLNLFVVNIEAWNLKNARSALEMFDQCIAKYPLKNGEEHQSILKMAYGRLAMHEGNIDEAIKNLETAIEHQQWFGQIGTNIEDLQAGIYTSMAESLIIKNNFLRTAPYDSSAKKLNSYYLRIVNSFKISWYLRKARLLLIEKLNDFEDAYVRHSDSMLEYPNLGSLFASLPKSLTKKFLSNMQNGDSRKAASLYYQAYLGESLLKNGSTREGLRILAEVSADPRSDFDRAIKFRAISLILQQKPAKDPAYQVSATELFRQAPSLIRNYALQLPADLSSLPPTIKKYLTGLFINNNENANYLLEYSFRDQQHILVLRRKDNGNIIAQGSDKDIFPAVNLFIDNTFKDS